MEEDNISNLNQQENEKISNIDNNHSDRHSDRIENILSNLEKFLNSEDITNTNRKFKNYLTEWEQIKKQNPLIDAEVEKKFWKLVDQYKKNYDWALWSNFKIKQEICLDLEKMLENNEKNILLDNFESLKNKWNKIGNIPTEHSKELWQHYHDLCKKIHDKTVNYFNENLKIKITLCEKIEGFTHPDNWQESTKFVKEAQKNWNLLGPVLRKDSEEIWKRFQTACNVFFNNQKNYYKELKKIQKNNLNQKKELCEIAESYKNSTNWKETSGQIHELQKQWKSIGSAGKKYEAAIWKRFKQACDVFFQNQKNYFDNLDEQRPLNFQKKEELCIKLENMSHFSDEDKYKLIIETQIQWKTIGPIPKELEKTLWERFRKPIDEYFNSRKERYEKDKKVFINNLMLKKQLCQMAEEYSVSDDWQAGMEQLKELQKKWNEIGPVPKENEKEIWIRFKTICDTFFERFKAHKNETKQKLMENLKKKIDLCFQAEIIAGFEVNSVDAEERAKWQLEKLSENFWYKVIDDESWEARANKIKELQQIWKEIGPVPKNKSQEIWERFQRACNWFFQNRKTNYKK